MTGNIIEPAIRALTRAGTVVEPWGFKKHWRSAHYHTGDIYQDGLQEDRRKEWEIEGGRYLQHLKNVSSEWPQLRLLADFMEVGTDPLRWRNFNGDDKKNSYTYPDDPKRRKEEQSKRVNKTQVRQLEYLDDGTVGRVISYTTPEELGGALEEVEKSAGGRVKLRLFVVEDPSREVIERLGYQFDIDPDFFRAHIFDFVWYNIRDPSWDPPSLYMDIAHKSWFQIRFCRARYFSSPARFSEGQDAVNKFNIGRKLYGDENKAYWDRDPTPNISQVLPHSAAESTELMRNLSDWFSKFIGKHKTPDEEQRSGEPMGMPNHKNNDNLDTGGVNEPDEERVDGKVGLMRTKATYWEKKGWMGKCDIGVLLLDPTIEAGFPLWRGHRNWNPTPLARDTADQSNSRVPSLTRSETKPTAEQSFFEDFIYWANRPEVVLGHPLATVCDGHDIPIMALLRLVCAEWLTLSQYIKTRFSQVDWEVTHPKEFLTQSQIDSLLNKLHIWRRWVPLYREMLSETKSRVFQFLIQNQQSNKAASSDPPHWDAYKDEFALVLKQMEEYEQRIDRLTTVVTSTINTADSRRVERLTLLATLFVPLSLVGTLFSMSNDITQIGDTFGYWAAVSGFLLIVLYVWARRTRSRRAK